MSSAPDTRKMNPRVLGRDVCPQKYKQDSHDYIARRPGDVRRPFPALPLLVRLPDDVAHDVPLALLAVYSRYGSTVPPNAGYVLGADLNCSESVGCHRQRAVIHPFEIADVSIYQADTVPKTRLPGDCDLARAFWSASFPAGKNAPNGCDQPIKFNRLGIELVAPRRERLFALTSEGMRG
jgi:hypothetical protein